MYVRQRFYGSTPKDNFGLFYSSTSGVSDFEDYAFYAQQDGWNHHALVFKNVGGTRRLTYYINGDYAGIVITSYSIHYTKLYDIAKNGCFIKF